MNRIATILFVLFFSTVNAQNMWINEIHYDNDGGDVGEFVEVVVPVGTNESDITITLYNGSTSAVNGTHSLSTFTNSITNSGFTIYYKMIAGLQNDDEGIALDNSGTLIQFLSYEGQITAVDGPAIGVTSTDIGVEETASTPIGSSLQLLGTGTDYTDFTWSGPHTATPGQVNSDGSTDQSLPVELTSFTATAANRTVILRWHTGSEVDNQGFIVTRATEKEAAAYEEIDSYVFNFDLRGQGTTSNSTHYEYADRQVFNGITYWYKLVDVDNNGVRTEHGPISATPFSTTVEEVSGYMPEKFTLYQNRPNPFNPGTKIEFDIPALHGGPIDVNLAVYNLLGQKVATLFNGVIDAGVYSTEWNGLDDFGNVVPSGIYMYQLVSENFVQTKRMVLIK